MQTWEIRVWSLGQEDSLKEEMATHSQYSCLENPIERGAWWAVVHGVTNSWTWLSEYARLGRRGQRRGKTGVPLGPFPTFNQRNSDFFFFFGKLLLLFFSHQVQLFAIPYTAKRQATLTFTIPWSLLKLMSIESVMPSNHLIFCCPLLFLSSILPSIRVFSKELALSIRWPKYWSFSFSNNLSKEYSGLISFRIH